MLIKVHKKTTFALSDLVLLLVCHIGILVLNKNAKKPFVAICFGFSEKIASLTGLIVGYGVCVINSSYSFQWIILKPSVLVVDILKMCM